MPTTWEFMSQPQVEHLGILNTEEKSTGEELERKKAV